MNLSVLDGIVCCLYHETKFIATDPHTFTVTTQLRDDLQFVWVLVCFSQLVVAIVRDPKGFRAPGLWPLKSRAPGLQGSRPP